MGRVAFFKRFLGILSISILAGVLVFSIPSSKVSLDNLPIDFRHDRLVLVTFWSIDCSVCLAELPVLKKIWSNWHNSHFDIIGVSMWYDDPKLLRRFTERNKSILPYPILWDGDRKVQREFGKILATPLSFLVDVSNRQIKKTYLGMLDLDQVDKDIRNILFDKDLSY
ncbi:peroxiredoxin family protein [Candidatus Ichthyocystis hellenicum]|uniref:peroxiredoxin family protein n=1 Tax=Candidatus Ichthyocystis hellenicum TaxID=1561003 RepID=UPI001585773F|nr:TlpA disulfide reductase family protein [Candidatus Ichthyocystis hellenicum]